MVAMATILHGATEAVIAPRNVSCRYDACVTLTLNVSQRYVVDSKAEVRSTAGRSLVSRMGLRDDIVTLADVLCWCDAGVVSITNVSR